MQVVLEQFLNIPNLPKSPEYNLSKEKEWGETIWYLWADGCSTFGRYRTKKAAMEAVKEYNLRLKK